MGDRPAHTVTKGGWGLGNGHLEPGLCYVPLEKPSSKPQPLRTSSLPLPLQSTPTPTGFRYTGEPISEYVGIDPELGDSPSSRAVFVGVPLHPRLGGIAVVGGQRPMSAPSPYNQPTHKRNAARPVKYGSNTGVAYRKREGTGPTGWHAQGPRLAIAGQQSPKYRFLHTAGGTWAGLWWKRSIWCFKGVPKRALYVATFPH